MLPDFIGLHCLGHTFAMPSTAFLSVNTFRSSGMFLSVASMMRNRGHWLSFWIVWLSSWLFSLICVAGIEVEHGGDILLCRFMLIMVWWGLEVCLRYIKWWSETNFAKNTCIMTHTKNHSNNHGYPTPKRQPASVTLQPTKQRPGCQL